MYAYRFIGSGFLTIKVYCLIPVQHCSKCISLHCTQQKIGGKKEGAPKTRIPCHKPSTSNTMLREKADALCSGTLILGLYSLYGNSWWCSQVYTEVLAASALNPYYLKQQQQVQLVQSPRYANQNWNCLPVIAAYSQGIQEFKAKHTDHYMHINLNQSSRAEKKPGMVV